MNMKKIKCQACGAECHAIKAHLKEAHGPDSDNHITLDEYEQQYPGAPLLSDVMKKKLAERKGDEAAPEKPKATVPPAAAAPQMQAVSGEDIESSYSTKAMHEIFGLKKERALNGVGKPVMVSVSNRTDSPDRVPVEEDYYPDIDALKNVLLALEFNEPIMIWGHAGVGKTSIFRYVCRHTNRRLVRVQHTAETQEHKIIGQMAVKKGFDKEGKAYSFTEFELGDLPRAALNGWVYLADEIDRAQPEVLSAYQAVLEGQPLHLPEAPPEYRVIVPHPDFRFVATGNSNGMGDETGIHRAVQRQDAATFERFSIVMQLNYLDKADEIEMLKDKAKVSQAHAEKMWAFADKIRSQFPHEFPLTIGPRVLIKIARLGRLKGNFTQGVQLAYANRLPETERKAAMDLAARMIG